MIAENKNSPEPVFSISDPAQPKKVSGNPPEPFGLPVPISPPSKPDPDVYDAWKKHLIKGYEQNREMFRQILDAFMRPYWMTIWMYRLLFGIGIGGFILAILLGIWKGMEFSVIFGGLSAITFLTYFVSQPLRSLEQNIEFITWLGLVYNTYWTRLMYANNESTIQTDLKDILNQSIDNINQLLDKQAKLTKKRLVLPEPFENLKENSK